MKKTKAAIIFFAIFLCIEVQATEIYEPDSVNNMPTIETDGTPMHRAIDYVGDVDYAEFTLYEMATVEIETHSSNSSADTKIWLYNSANKLLEVNDDKPDSLLSKIKRTLPADTYRIEIRHWNNSEIIPEYSITVKIVGLEVFIAGADFIYSGSSTCFSAFMNTHDSEAIDVDWSSNSPLAGFVQDTLETDYTTTDTDITITASYEQAQMQKQVRLRSGAKPAGEVNYYAVIVGIADYPGTNSDLSYTVKDATAIRNELLKDPAWKNENITLLLDSQATPPAIQSAISDMTQLADSGDVCLFYYSGHGGRTTAGEYLYVYGGNVYDYDFAVWINALPTDNYIILLDACYSGGQIYSLDTGYFNPSYSSTRNSFAANIARSLGIDNLNQNGRGAVLASSSATEESWESPSLGHGYFTYYILEAMAGAADFDRDGFITVQESYLYIDGIGLDSQQVQIYDGNRLPSPILQYNSDIYISSIEIEGNTLIPAERYVSFLCKANYSNGSQTDITDMVVWDIADNEAVVSIDGEVYASNALSGSTFTITATYNHIHLASLELTVYEPKYSDGKGFLEAPYILSDAADITLLSQSPSDWDKHFILSADIDMTGAAFTPIGNYDVGFSGKFNGNGYTLSNITLNDWQSDYAAVFGLIEAGGRVENLGVININIDAAQSYYIGSIAGWTYGVISGCYSSGNISGDIFVGGISGGISGTGSEIINSYSTVNITAQSSPGGIVCYALVPAKLTNCYFAGTITSGDYFGGVVTFSTNATVTNTFFDTDRAGRWWTAAGQGKTTAWLTQSDNLIASGWDYDGVWHQIDGQYPILGWQELRLWADLNGDGLVDEFDLIIMASQWLQEGGLLTADIYPFGGDGVVNLLDYALFSDWFKVIAE